MRRAALALTVLLCAASLASMTALQRTGAVHGNDFKHLYAGTRILAAGHNPYDPAELARFAQLQGWVDGDGAPVINPFVYLPTTGLLLRPLAALPYPAAQTVWFWLNWALAWGIVAAAPRWLRLERPDLARLAGATLLAGGMPFLRQMTAGQMNVATAALLTVAGGLLLRRRAGWAGVALGIGFTWKIAPALLIGALAVRRRWWPGIATGVLTGGGLWLASFALAGPEAQRDGLRQVMQMGYGRSTWEALGRDYYRDPFNQSPNALMHHLWTENPYTVPWKELGAGAANGLTVGVSLILTAAWLTAEWRGRTGGRESAAQNSAERDMALYWGSTLLMLLLPSILWDHYVVQALPALMVWIGARAAAIRPGRALMAVGMIALLAIPWMHTTPAHREGAGILLMSLRLWPLLVLYGGLLFDAIRQGDPPQ
jgi:hypothetical protein